jgi:hypothetical protein
MPHWHDMARAIWCLKREPEKVLCGASIALVPALMGVTQPSKSRVPVRTRSITFGPSLDGLAVECEVETLALDFGRGTKTNDQID